MLIPPRFLFGWVIDDDREDAILREAEEGGMRREDMRPPCFSSGMGDTIWDKHARLEGVSDHFLESIHVKTPMMRLIYDVAGQGGEVMIIALCDSRHIHRMPSSRRMEKVKKRFGIKQDPQWFPDISEPDWRVW